MDLKKNFESQLIPITENTIANEKLYAIEKINQDMQSLLECTMIMNELVKDQGEQINSIEDQIINSKSKVNQANKELEQASAYQIKYRCGVVGIIIGGVLSGGISLGLSLPFTGITVIGGSLTGYYYGNKLSNQLAN